MAESERAVNGVDVVYYHATNVDASRKWFGDLTGAAVSHDFGSWVEFDIGGDTRFAIDAYGDPAEIPNAVASFAVDDLQVFLDGAAANGFEPFNVMEVGNSRVASFRDPDGNLVQFSARIE